MASSPITKSPVPSSIESPPAEILTPSRKVQALLAGFEDTDSDVTPRPNQNKGAGQNIRRVSGNHAANTHESESSDEDILPQPAKSRMAARLEAARSPSNDREVESQEDSVSARRIGRGMAKHDHEPESHQSAPSENSQDELFEPAPTKRLLTKRKRSPVVSERPQHATARPVSPLFFESPSRPVRNNASSPTSHRSNSEAPLQDQSSTSNSKFLALVEKHRRQRLEKEAALAAKKTLQEKNSVEENVKPRKQRGSSPADDTEEESDDSNIGAAKRLTKEARPTRKASKKALEEMNRETQRMNRNMQLAHQARTKKKITKESLLARFNFSLPDQPAQPAVVSDSTTVSSAADSDMEARKRLDTPLTSPLLEPTVEKDDLGQTSVSVNLESSLVPDSQIGRVLDIGSNCHSATNVEKGKGRAADWVPNITPEVSTVEAKLSQKLQTLDSKKGSLTSGAVKAALLLHREDEDAELEIVVARGETRKYAVFEKLPKHKAKETPSHLALRSLAHLIGDNDKSRASMTSAEMDVSLRKAARLQARQERQQRIEELKAKGVVIQTAEERERDQQEVEDIFERAKQEAAEISKREKEAAKKDGTYTKDGLDDDDDSDDEEFEDEIANGEDDTSDVDSEDNQDDEADDEELEDESKTSQKLIDEEADDDEGDDEASMTDSAHELGHDEIGNDGEEMQPNVLPHKRRIARVVSDDEDDSAPHHTDSHRSPQLPSTAKTPQSLVKSARKQIPGLQMSDDLELGLTQAFAATMADSQSQSLNETQEQDSLEMTRDLPSPNIGFAPKLARLDSIDVVSDSQPASQTQPLNIDFSLSQSQRIPQSPLATRALDLTQFTPSQAPFEPTQDGGYLFSPFHGNRFSLETPLARAPQSTVDTVIVPNDTQDSPVVQRKGRLRRRQAGVDDSEDDQEVPNLNISAFEMMKRAAKKAPQSFDKSKSAAKDIIDEAAEESEDEYAGLGGASDDDGNDEENEDDRRMIDEDTQAGKGDEAKFAGLYADRERKQDEAAVSKLLKDITTGALRRKRGANDELDLSDEEDAAARRRESKRREFAKMRRELLKDEAVGKIAEDKKKEAFLKSIEDRDEAEDDEDIDVSDPALDDSQDASHQPGAANQALVADRIVSDTNSKQKLPLDPVSDSQLNRTTTSSRRKETTAHKRPSTLAEIRESVSFLIEEPDSQAAMVDLGLSDSEDEPEAYVNLDRHFKAAEADENAAEDDDAEDLGDFIVDDDGLATEDDDYHNSTSSSSVFKKPGLPSTSSFSALSRERAPFSERRTGDKQRPNVVNRLTMLRQSSSSSSLSSVSSTTKMAFYTNAGSGTAEITSKVPTLLRRATTNSGLGGNGSGAGLRKNSNDNVSATGVVTSRTERGSVSEEKEFVRRGTGGRRNAVNYRPTMTMKEEKMSQRAGIVKKKTAGTKKGGGFLSGLLRGDTWS